MSRSPDTAELAQAGLGVEDLARRSWLSIVELPPLAIEPSDDPVDPFERQFQPVDRDAPISWKEFPELAREVPVDYETLIKRELNGRPTWPGLLALFSRSEEGPNGSYDFYRDHSTFDGVVRTGLCVAADGRVAWRYDMSPNGGWERRIDLANLQGGSRTRVVAAELLKLCLTRISR